MWSHLLLNLHFGGHSSHCCGCRRYEYCRRQPALKQRPQFDCSSQFQWSSPRCLLDMIQELPNPANEQNRRFLQVWTMVANMPISAATTYIHSCVDTTSLLRIPARTLLRIQAYLKNLCKTRVGQYLDGGYMDTARMYVSSLHVAATGNQNDLFQVLYSIGDFGSPDHIKCAPTGCSPCLLTLPNRRLPRRELP